MGTIITVIIAVAIGATAFVLNDKYGAEDMFDEENWKEEDYDEDGEV